MYAIVTNSAGQVTICRSLQDNVRGYLANIQYGELLKTSPSLAPYASLLSTPGAAKLLTGYAFGEIPLSSLPPAFQTSAADILSTPVTYSVLASNNFMVCSEGIHPYIFTWGIFMLVGVTGGFPFLAFFFVRAAIKARMNCVELVGPDVYREWKEVEGDWLPLHWQAIRGFLCAWRGRGVKKEGEEGERHERADRLINSTLRAVNDNTAPIIAVWTVGERLPSVFYFKSLDQALITFLAIPAAYTAGVTQGGGMDPNNAVLLQIATLLITLLATGGMAYITYFRTLFPPHDMWKQQALIWVLCLTGLAGLLNSLTFFQEKEALNNRMPSPSLKTAAQVFSYILFFGFLALAVYLLLSFFRSLEAASKHLAEATRLKATPTPEAASAQHVESLRARGVATTETFSINPLYRGGKIGEGRKGRGRNFSAAQSLNRGPSVFATKNVLPSV